MPSGAAGSASPGPAFSVSMRHAFVPFSGDFWFFGCHFAEASLKYQQCRKPCTLLPFTSLSLPLF